MRADLAVIRAGLELLHGRSPGRVHVCAKGAWNGAAFTDLDEAAAYALSLDQREGVYARCTTLRDDYDGAGRGEAVHSLALPGLWADLDLAGPGHKLPAGGLPLLEDEAAARGIVSHLPEPTLWVHSGGGLYPWWLLEEPHVIGDDLAEVEALSTDWHDSITRTAADCGWHVGGTGDLARVLRMPGTINRKEGGERPCRVLEQGGPRYSLAELRAALPAPPERAPALPTTPPSSVWDSDLFTQPRTGPGPFDVLAEHASWSDLLTPAGFTYVGADNEGRELWQRPGGTSDYSLKAGDHVAVVWSTDAGLPAGKGQKLTPGRLFAHLHHGGDERAAARDLLAVAHDEPCSPGAAGLPGAVVGALRDAFPRSATGASAPPAPPVTDSSETPAEATPIPGQSWGSVDLSDVLNGLLSGTIERLAPTVGLRAGGGALFYAGKVNGVAGASGSGKSWTALAACLQEIAAGHHVVYVDLEDDALGVVGRLLDLGADPADVLARFHYVNPDESYSYFARERLLSMVDELAPTLVVIDSTGESMALDGAKPNDDDDTARWFKSLPAPIARRGPAVLVLDHVVKADDGGLWPIGSQRKRAAISGAQYMQAVVRPFARGQRGAAKLVCAKDRHGTYRPGEKVADLQVEPDGDRLTFTLAAPAVPVVVAGAAFRPTALMERVSTYLDMVEQPTSRSTVTERVQGNRAALLQALDVLKAEGYVEVTIGPRKAELCVSVRPYRQQADPLCDLFLGTQERVEPSDPSPTPLGQVPTRSSRKEEERGTGENQPYDPFLGTGQERVRNGSEDTHEDGSGHCVDCGQQLLLRRPGRTTCERCDLAAKAAS